MAKASEAIAAGDNNRRYSTTSINNHRDKIKELFLSLDTDGDGTLSKDELRYVTAQYLGNNFDEGVFISWFDVHGGSSISDQLDQTEFGWFIGDIASGFGKISETQEAKAAIPQIILAFEQLLKARPTSA